MAHWINIEEGSYVVDAALLFTPENTAVAVEDAVMEVYVDGNLDRRVRGSGMAISALIVELLEDSDDMHLLLDLDKDFKYILEIPVIRAGKALAPDVKSLLHYTAQGPLKRLSNDDYEALRSRLLVIGPHS